MSYDTEAKGNQYSCSLIITLRRSVRKWAGSATQKRSVNLPKGLGQKNGLKGPKVSAIIPEAGRSIPGQDEAVRKDGGGLQ